VCSYIAVLVSKSAERNFAGDGGKETDQAGRARYKLKPCQGRPMSPLNLLARVRIFLHQFAHGNRWCKRAPGLPCPSDWMGRDVPEQNSRENARQNREACVGDDGCCFASFRHCDTASTPCHRAKKNGLLRALRLQPEGRASATIVLLQLRSLYVRR